MTDNIYQKQTASKQEIAAMIGVDPAAADLIVSISPCRSGTTVMLRVFGAAGVPAHFQPLKNILRWKIQRGEWHWAIPTAHPIVYVKETLGPYTALESSFNPLESLLLAGFPPEKLHVLIYGRAPLQTWASWYKWWRGKTSVQNFILAYQTTHHIFQFAQQEKLHTVTLLYEAFRDNDEEDVLEKLLTKFSISYTAYAARKWHSLPLFGHPDSNIYLPEEPPIFITPHIHDSVYQAEEFIYGPTPPEQLARLPQEHLQAIATAGLFDLYEIWRINCQADLELSIAPAHVSQIDNL